MKKETNMNDHDAMLAIQEQLDGTEWTPDTLEEIARIMIAAGYVIRGRRDDRANEIDEDSEFLLFADGRLERTPKE